MPLDLVNPQNFIGLTEEQANILAKQQGVTIRVTRRDSVKYIHDMSYRIDRVSVEIEERIVVSAKIG